MSPDVIDPQTLPSLGEEVFQRDFHHLERAREERGEEFMRTRLGRLWLRYRKTKYRKELLEEIREKAILLCRGCHKEITAKERRLGKRLTRERVLSN